MSTYVCNLMGGVNHTEPTKCKNNVMLNGGLSVSKTTHYSVSIREFKFYVISNDSYFKLGVISYIESLGTPMLNEGTKNSITVNTIDSIDLKKITKIVNAEDASSCNIFIADKNLKDTVSLFLSHEKNCYAIFLSGSEVTKDCLKTITKSKNHQYGFRTPDLPSYTLLSGLNHREKRVCNYIYLGYSPKLIGMILGIHPKTVSGYKTRIMKKIGCKKKSDFNSAIINYNKLCRDIISI